MPKTKPLVKFLNRTVHDLADIELADVLSSITEKGKHTVFDHADPAKHPTLTKRSRKAHAQTLTLRHLRTSVAEGVIKQVYEDFSTYLREVLVCAARGKLDPDRFVGHHDFHTDAKTLLALRSHDEIIAHVAAEIFRKIEQSRDTKATIDAVDKKLGLRLHPTIVAAAMPFLDSRHLLVHREGIVDDAYAKRYPEFRDNVGKRLDTAHPYARDAYLAIKQLATHLDERLIDLDILRPSDVQK